MKSKKYRLCECGCGHSLSGQSTQKFASTACRQRAYRDRKPLERGGRCNTKIRHHRNTDREMFCCILFDGGDRPVRIDFIESTHAAAFVHDMKFLTYSGRYWKVFEPTNADGFCDGFEQLLLFEVAASVTD